MIYLSGSWSTWVDTQLRLYPVGPIVTPDIGVGYLEMGTHRPWAADNGCFAKGKAFDLSAYIGWLEKIQPQHKSRCLFATAPDVVGDWQATWERSEPVLPSLRALGFAAAVVLQDGAETATGIDWDAFDVAFVGGTTDWKLSKDVQRLSLEARRMGKWVHWGRVNSFKRLRMAQNAGANSADGTFLKYGYKKNVPRVKRWMDQIHEQMALFKPRAR